MRALAALMKEVARTPPAKKPPRTTRWLRLKRWLGWASTATCVWCPSCGNELTTCPDTECVCSEQDANVAYVCAACTTGSLWDFGAPVPLLLEYTTPGFGPEWVEWMERI